MDQKDFKHRYDRWTERISANQRKIERDSNEPYWETNEVNDPSYAFLGTIYNGVLLESNYNFGMDIYAAQLYPERLQEPEFQFLIVIGPTACDVIHICQGAEDYDLFYDFFVIMSHMRRFALHKPSEEDFDEPESITKSSNKRKSTRNISKDKKKIS